jgi:hypothetical protein
VSILGSIELKIEINKWKGIVCLFLLSKSPPKSYKIDLKKHSFPFLRA